MPASNPVAAATPPRRDSHVRKVIRLADAVALIPDGAVLMIGGFMGAGTPPRLIDALVRQRKRDLTVIANDTARPGVGIGKLVDAPHDASGRLFGGAA